MKRIRSVFRVPFVLVAVVAFAFQASPAQAGIARGSFHQENLVSDIPGLAAHTDPQLVNPWGLSASPTSPMWVSDNNAGVSTLYNGAGIKQGLVVKIPAPGNVPGGTPTGTVFNNTSDFLITTGSDTSKALFFFDTEDGTVLAWNRAAGDTAKIMVDNSGATDSAGDVGAVYKGLTNGSVGTANYLYAANFRFGTVDVFNDQFQQVSLAGSFTDPSLPAGFAPFGIQNINGSIFVTYAKQNAEKHDDVSGPGNGFVDIYTTGGALVSRSARLASAVRIRPPRSARLTSGMRQIAGGCLRVGAGDGNRTHVTSLEGWRTTIVLRPLCVNRMARGASLQGQRLEYLDF